jgi:hypothetical protein
MDATTALILIALLMTKHCVCDFLLQVPYHYLNKGKYGHPGGIAHAGIHVVGTFLALAAGGITLAVATLWAFVDGIVHYHADWAKMRINSYYKWNAMNSERFWWLLGFDQWVHSITYVVIVWYLI